MPNTIPFPPPREPEPDWTAIALAKLDVNRLPERLRESASAILRSAARRRGYEAVRVAETVEEEQR